jgi:hypothetical protein
MKCHYTYRVTMTMQDCDRIAAHSPIPDSNDPIGHPYRK